MTSLERLVATARHQAQQEAFRRLQPLLSTEAKARLDRLLITDATLGGTPLVWLQRRANANSPRAILASLEKLTCLRGWGVEGWDLSQLPPNRLKCLAQLARRSTNQALQRMPAVRRYPILVGFLHQSLVEITDEAMDLFDRCLAETDRRARRDLNDFRVAMARATHEKVRLFGELGRVILDPNV